VAFRFAGVATTGFRLPHTFYWHDYETWGADPARDRPAQFAGLRTDADLNPLGEPLVLYCRPADDLLPQPDACLITGITPQLALERGLPEADFIGRIHTELARAGTCGAGYNSIRFDDEVTRYTLYRNLLDPYAREWRNGNSRWDLIDVMRLAHALRPEGIEWPRRDDGKTSFRLEDLSAVNGIAHESAHDALSDVYATIALARLLRERQPRLFRFALTLRDKRQAEALLNLGQPQPLLHVSSKYPAERGCIAPVLALARHPVNRNGVLVLDLRSNPQELLELDVEQIRARVFSRADELPGGAERLPLKAVHVNRSPILAPMNTLTPEAARRWAIDPARVQAHAETLRQASGLGAKLHAVFAAPQTPQRPDPEQDLYGGFIDDQDRLLLEAVRATAPEELGRRDFPFQDRRLPTLLFRYRARNWPDTLASAERALWDLYRRRRLRDPAGGGSITLDQYRARLEALRGGRGQDPEALVILEALQQWGDRLDS
jgi:exodeoxyribonuclease-1